MLNDEFSTAISVCNEITSMIKNPRHKIWVMLSSVGKKSYPTSICYDEHDDVDDLIDKIHRRMHNELKNIDMTRLSLHYHVRKSTMEDTIIKRDTLVVDMLQKAKELGLENSIDCPFVIVMSWIM